VQPTCVKAARLSHRNSVCPCVCPSVHHTGGSVKHGAR